eukprot:gb/GECH01012096.1/.p1 GENE.gb/GECH01012096.1/~~gb/GECH01012096.1/.p1  ORF type:complete len:248 (+),score=75.89 gb/GECH01012096.1/:1-744(+)
MILSTMRNILIVTLLASVFAVVNADISKWDFGDFFKGDWKAEKTVISKDTEFPQTEPIQGFFNVTSGAHDGAIVAKFNEIATQINSAIFTFETTTPKAGSVSMISTQNTEDEDEENEEENESDMKFEYEFQETLNDFIVSRGRYEGAKGSGAFSFICTSSHSFIWSFTSDKDGTVIEYVGRKAEADVPAGFFKKYGPTVLMVVFFLGSRLLTQRLTPQAQGQGQAQQQGQTSGGGSSNGGNQRAKSD